jgi:chemosensory pili system protein ChpC
MAKAKAQTRMHLLEIPLSRFHLLVPSATVAEVVTMSPLTMIPGMAPWVIGVLGWRGRAVPVISFEALLMSAVVFYPLPGRSDSEFFAMLSVREPQPRVIMDAADVVPSPAGAVESPYVASTVKLGDSTLLIPDFEALRAAFYPTPQ